MREHHKRNEYVLLHVYVNGHGYADANKQSQILLNQRIHFNINESPNFDRAETTFMNPYPLESELLKIFEHFKNVCIVMMVDTCRELN